MIIGGGLVLAFPIFLAGRKLVHSVVGAPANFLVHVQLRDGFSKEEFFSRLHEWQDERAFERLNSKFVSERLLSGPDYEFGPSEMKWIFRFQSIIAFNKWRMEVLNQKLIRNHKIPASVVYKFELV